MKMSKDEIREQVFARDNGRCVFCGARGLDAHHVLERKLWSESESFGYLLDNLITVCESCHLRCERTQLSPEEAREAANITRVIVPSHMYADQQYDKWGNPVFTSGSRAHGPLFHDENTQKALKEGHVLDCFVPYMKYPRTPHLPWSHGYDDDIYSLNLSHFEGQEVVVTEKLDGENTSMYNDKLHTRSLDSSSHPSQSWVRNFWSKRAHEIPYGWRICGENVYAQHSIRYTRLSTYFYGFSVWEFDHCFSWDETLEWFAYFNIEPVAVLYEGLFDVKRIRSIPIDETTQEGYVIRVRDGFSYRDFQQRVAKYVRPDHVRTKERWERSWTKNEVIKHAV